MKNKNVKKACDESILITNVQKDFEGMCEEMNNYYQEILEENL